MEIIYTTESIGNEQNYLWFRLIFKTIFMSSINACRFGAEPLTFGSIPKTVEIILVL